ncbi:CDP-diacylglycerol--glycerol-3-phosphate 3-phosphatidyltransferase [Tistlia consotensis]|uniref:CDP-diacylglycerol--glycerol-3-phosphate 3-phosphatidyltransferase n=1 Tax=Tistlia consotensis USBA 355 TaxID=560819 RepID=A0A1Y6CL96_9PROT|nr:CDP-diacylglycerol--glycerol-3-phosphate 3-phosphatidyltransferase [Tistlia consotensis]SMF60938.1 CDP-diacylglycerol--glycerol-3-phosphate 3-phosphatidyltransferase [Tistlia consotensis USBA 355]SNR92413.1 CDP-diacylglycerol--glycerol-3-phosphate 3-phosphatidyltransferase [Tistlia consotensis]
MLTSLPNLLTLARIVVIPLVVALLYLEGPTPHWIAFGLFSAACITDFFDGWLARRLNVVTPLGRFLDPIADKLLVVAILVMLVAGGEIAGVSVIAALAILAREILVSGLREYLAELRVGMPVSKLAKWKTTVQMAALAVLLVAPALPGLPLLLALGEALLWLAALLTVVTGWDYVTRGLKHMTAR